MINDNDIVNSSKIEVSHCIWKESLDILLQSDLEVLGITGMSPRVLVAG